MAARVKWTQTWECPECGWQYETKKVSYCHHLCKKKMGAKVELKKIRDDNE